MHVKLLQVGVNAVSNAPLVRGTPNIALRDRGDVYRAVLSKVQFPGRVGSHFTRRQTNNELRSERV